MVDNKFLLATMVAKRAKELQAGAKALVESKHKLPIIIALEEIKAGKVYLKEEKEPLKSEDVFHEEGESVKIEESVKPEDISGEGRVREGAEKCSDRKAETDAHQASHAHCLRQPEYAGYGGGARRSFG